MKNIFIIIKKETTDLLRDRRTLLTMLVMPLLIFPLMFTIIGKISSNQAEKEKVKTLQIGIVDPQNAGRLVQLLQNHKGLSVKYYKDVADAEPLLKDDKLDGALVIDRGFDHKVDSMKTGQITLYYKSVDWSVKERVMDIISGYKATLIGQRLAKLNIDAASIDPLEVIFQDVSTNREKFGKTIGGMLPYILIIFSFLGCTFPAIDLFTNEKERGTLETLLSTPVKRLEILFGKMSVVSLIGLITALLSMVGLSFGLKQFAHTMPEDIMGFLTGFLVPSNIIMLFGMLLPLIIFFSGILTLITTYAKSYKEAQTIISPMMFLIILPAVVGLMPGIELTGLTAIIPITNISLATKEIISGTVNYYLYALVVGSLLVYAALGVFVSVKWFGNESHIVKS